MTDTTTEKPVIGISGSKASSKSVLAMIKRVEEAGGIPLLLTNHKMRDAAKDIKIMQGLVVMGNDFDVDINKYVDRYPEGDPRRQLHPETKSTITTPDSDARAKYEEELITLAMDKKVPLFGVCGGLHQINVYGKDGGTLIQHIPDLLGNAKHSNNAGNAMSCPVVPVHITENTHLAAIADGQMSLMTPFVPPNGNHDDTVNTYHHQAIETLRKGFIASATSDEYATPDGEKHRLIEAIEPDPNGPYAGQYIVAVQWHPEFLPDSPLTKKLLQNLKSASQEYARENNLTYDAEAVGMQNMISRLNLPVNNADISYKNFLPRAQPGQSLAR